MNLLNEIINLGKLDNLHPRNNPKSYLSLLLFIKNKNSEYIECNSTLASFAGLSKESDILKATDYDLCWNKYANLYRSYDKIVMKTNQPYVSCEPLIDANNNRVMVTSVKTVAKLNNKIIGLVGLTVIHDLDKKVFDVLSKKEYICLNYYIKGKSAREIAEIMHLSKRTIEWHLTNIKIKLNCQNKSELFDKALSFGMLSP
jgi:DNA-binding CsgD family transcriptional regulator